MADPKATNPRFDGEINLKAILGTAVGLALVIAVSMVLMWWMSKGLKSQEEAADPAPSPLPEANIRQLPPAPRLQPSPASDLTPEQELEQMRAEEEELLTGYGWVDREAGLARIPVERALELAAEGGLPGWDGGSADAEGGDDSPTAAAGGTGDS